MFTVSAVVLTAVQTLRPVFQSIRAEKQSSAFTQAVDSGQLSGSVALTVVCQELLNPTDWLLRPNPWLLINILNSKPSLMFASLSTKMTHVLYIDSYIQMDQSLFGSGSNIKLPVLFWSFLSSIWCQNDFCQEGFPWSSKTNGSPCAP